MNAATTNILFIRVPSLRFVRNLGTGEGILPALPLPSATGPVWRLFREAGKSLPNSARRMRAHTFGRTRTERYVLKTKHLRV
jgi:hypothetical protein